MKNKKYFQVDTYPENRSADINIYGEITSWPWLNSDVSAFNIIQQIDGLDVDEINVYINSPGGEVAEAVAIYSALKRNKAKINTYCDGFACSAASIIFCAGDTRTMGKIAMLMIHNCMSYVGYANAEELRKAADDTDKINQSSIEAYKAVSNLSEDKIKELMSNETWLTADEALEYGFATQIADETEDSSVVQSVQPIIHKALTVPKPSENNQNIIEMLTVLSENFNKFNAFVSKIEQNYNENGSTLTEAFSNFIKNTM